MAENYLLPGDFVNHRDDNLGYYVFDWAKEEGVVLCYYEQFNVDCDEEHTFWSHELVVRRFHEDEVVLMKC